MMFRNSGLSTAAAPIDSTGLAAELVRLEEVLAALPKPSSLIKAELALAEARDAHAAAERELRAAIEELGSSVGRLSKVPPAILARQAAVSAAGEAMRPLWAALREERDKFAPRYAELLDPHREAAARAILSACETFKLASSILEAIDRVAAQNGLEPPRQRIQLPVLDHVARVARSAANGSAR